ncbi:MAG TPA: Na+/H+ antiporter subunit E [Casimicrobiaceae bacterium]|nr:Na+/H+ antiporter subunit E [Casimicrobiaceae bacterium]
MSLPRLVVAFLAWLALDRSIAVVDLALGLATAAAASSASVRLLPRGAAGIGVLALLAYLPHFLLYSLRGGLDVARRALALDMRLLPGFVDVQTLMPRGFARHTFTTITSLMPGSLPCADSPSSLRYHCLDTAQPVGQQIEAEEHALRGALLRTTR